jgi:hypothetical protein
MRGRLWAVAMLCGLTLVVACGPPPFLVHVTFQGAVDVERGSPVIYQGVNVGHVDQIGLRQQQPSEAGFVAVTLAITDPGVVLREKDRFHQASHRGVEIIEVEPWPEASPPLLAGGTVAGVPPLVTRLEDSVGGAIKSIEAVVVEALEDALESLEDTPRDAGASDRAGRPSSQQGSLDGRPPGSTP